MCQDIDELLHQAEEAWNRMTPEEREAMRQEQRESWVRGEMGLDRKGEEGSTTVSRPHTKEEIQRILDEYDAVDRSGPNWCRGCDSRLDNETWEYCPWCGDARFNYVEVRS